VDFDLDYGALLSAMTASYVAKRYVTWKPKDRYDSLTLRYVFYTNVYVHSGRVSRFFL